MANNEDDIMPSTSMLLFPDLMTRDELIAILKYKFKRMNVNTSKISKLTDDELLEQFKKFVMPKPQRKEYIACHSSDNSKIKNSNDLGKVSLDEMENLGSMLNGINPINRRRNYEKRHNNNNTEYHSPKKSARKHSPIRFP
uniref:Ashwin n=1 Tax=Onchocerca volvulus TaxID=6282 RepID=A0A8R1U377_ONCVO